MELFSQCWYWCGQSQQFKIASGGSMRFVPCPICGIKQSSKFNFLRTLNEDIFLCNRILMMTPQTSMETMKKNNSIMQSKATDLCVWSFVGWIVSEHYSQCSLCQKLHFFGGLQMKKIKKKKKKFFLEIQVE